MAGQSGGSRCPAVSRAHAAAVRPRSRSTEPVAARSRSRRLRPLVRDLPLSTSVQRGRSRTTGASGLIERAGAGTQATPEQARGTNENVRKEKTLATTTWNEREGKRRRRRDRGSFQVTERDLELLFLIAEQYAITLDQLARLLNRTYRTARGLRDRWCNADWTQSARLA